MIVNEVNVTERGWAGHFICSDSHKDKVFNEVMSWYKTQNISNEIIECKRKIAELEAKVYAYEKIIANSNFAPIMRENSEKK